MANAFSYESYRHLYVDDFHGEASFLVFKFSIGASEAHTVCIIVHYCLTYHVITRQHGRSKWSGYHNIWNDLYHTLTQAKRRLTNLCKSGSLSAFTNEPDAPCGELFHFPRLLKALKGFTFAKRMICACNMV